MINNFLGFIKKTHSCVKTALSTFWVTFGKIGLLFTPTSGHTALNANVGSFPLCYAFFASTVLPTQLFT